MLLMIIDILERLLGWMESFTGNARSPRDVQAETSAGEPTDDDLLRAYAALKKQYPLKNAPSTKICGAENKRTKLQVIHLEKQDSRVWDNLSDDFGDYYNIVNA